MTTGVGTEHDTTTQREDDMAKSGIPALEDSEFRVPCIQGPRGAPDHGDGTLEAGEVEGKQEDLRPEATPVR